MKHIFLSLTFVALFAAAMVGFAQTNTPTSDTPASAASVTPAKDAAPSPAAAPEAATPAAPIPAAAEAPAPAATPAADKPAAAAQSNTVIPLIVMDDVPLTDAIRNLARQAGLNYLLDPSIGFGQLGPDGKPMPQPTVSIRWENITAEQALNALLNNYTLQLTEDPKSKIARVTKKDPAALEPLFTKIFQLKYASPANLITNVQATFTDKRSRVMPDVRTSQLVVVATEREVAAVGELVANLDTKTRQVLIEARLLETVVNPSTSKGIDWSGTVKANSVTFGNGVVSGAGSSGSSSANSIQNLNTAPGTPVNVQYPGGASYSYTPSSASSSTANSTASSTANNVLNSVFGNGGFAMNTASGINPSTFFLNSDGVKAVLSFLNTYAETKVISSPRTVTLDNETAMIEVGTQYPIVNTTAGTANTTGGSQVTYSNLTVRLSVTPRISANNYVKLMVTPRVVRLGDLVQSIVGGVPNTVPSFETREINTTVMIPSGNTLVMGGLIQDNVHQQNTKVPILGDIPGLGLLFRNDSKSRTKSNMTIFLTPTIVEDEDFQPTKTTFLKTKVPVKDAVEDGDWSAWDSGQPKNWSKKAAPEATFDDSLAQPGTTSKTPANN